MKRLFTTLIFTGAALAQTPAASDSLDALRSLKTATELGVNYRDYSTRLIDAKTKADKYLAAAPQDDAARATVESVTRMYVLALQIWTATIQKTPRERDAVAKEIMASPELSVCADMPQLIAAATKQSANWKPDPLYPKITRSTPAETLAWMLTPRVFWLCAAEKLKN